MLKMSDNPPMLPPGAQVLADLGGRWWVAHTKSRAEKAFAWDLHRRGIGYYLPMVERVGVSGGKKRRVLAPLFPSYVFLCGNEEDRYEAMTTDHLCQTIGVVDQDGLVGELMHIHKALTGHAELDLYPYATVGRRCRVTAGPFRGVEGCVIQRRQLARLLLQVSILGQGASMEIDADLLEPVD